MNRVWVGERYRTAIGQAEFDVLRVDDSGMVLCEWREGGGRFRLHESRFLERAWEDGPARYACLGK